MLEGDLKKKKKRRRRETDRQTDRQRQRQTETMTGRNRDTETDKKRFPPLPDRQNKSFVSTVHFTELRSNCNPDYNATYHLIHCHRQALSSLHHSIIHFA